MPDLAEQIRGFIDSGATPVTAQEVVEAHRWPVSPEHARPRYRRPRRMNTYAIGAAAMATAICVLVVVLVFGVDIASSPKTTVVTPACPAFVPASWQRVTFGGLTMYAPGNWTVESRTIWSTCNPLLSNFSPNGIVLDGGTDTEPPTGCPVVLPLPRPSGVLIDPGPNGPLEAPYGSCLHINGLTACPVEATDQSKLVINLAVHIAGRARPVAVEIGLAGGGKVAHDIEYSMRASGSTSAPPTTSTTTASESVLGRKISAFEALANRGFGATYTATYAVVSNNTHSTEVVYSSGDGKRLAYKDYYPGQSEIDNIFIEGQPAVICSELPNKPWTCDTDPAPNGSQIYQNQAVSWMARLELLNYFAPYLVLQSPSWPQPIPEVVISQREVRGIEAMCLDGSETGEPPLSVCVSGGGVPLSYSHRGDPTIEIAQLSNMVPNGAFTPPVTPSAS